MKKLLVVLAVVLLGSLVFAASTPQSAVLQWSPPSTYADLTTPLPTGAVTGYNVYTSPTTTGTFNLLGTTAGTVLTYTDPVNIAPNTALQKCYQVSALLINAPESGRSNTVCSNFTGPSLAAGVPVNLTVTVH